MTSSRAMNISFENVEVRVGERNESLFSLKSFEIPSGSRLLIRGPSGAGKTTFLHLIAGLLEPARGAVYVDGKDINQLSEDRLAQYRRDHVALVFQKLNLLNHLTATENVRLAKNVSAESADHVLSQVGLSAKASEFVSKLSLGEQQRVAVARVLASSAQIILADEPTSSLDDKNASDVMKLLITASEGKTLIVVSHDQRIESFFSEIRNFKELTQ